MYFVNPTLTYHFFSSKPLDIYIQSSLLTHPKFKNDLYDSSQGLGYQGMIRAEHATHDLIYFTDFYYLRESFDMAQVDYEKTEIGIGFGITYQHEGINL